MGAVTASRVKESIIGNMRLTIADITFSASYATGGDTVSLSLLGLSEAFAVIIAGQPDGYAVEYDATNKKFLAYRSAGFTPAGTISKPTFTVEAAGSILANAEIGLSADTAAATLEGGTGITAQRVLTTTSPVGVPTLAGTAVAATVMVEVANAVDLSAVVFRAVVIGA